GELKQPFVIQLHYCQQRGGCFGEGSNVVNISGAYPLIQPCRAEAFIVYRFTIFEYYDLATRIRPLPDSLLSDGINARKTLLPYNNC
ncbi:hypothetical protein EZS27_038075, partial [termite gut metagenome]